MPTASPRVSTVIPNWNGLEHLPECLGALEALSFKDFEVILVDNASSDDSVAWTQEHYPEVRIVQRSDNGGFSKAVNDGIEVARGEYVALLNNDTAVEAGWLGALVEALDGHPAYHLAASKMILFHEPHLLNAAGDIYVLSRLAAANRGLREPVSHYGTMERVLGACAGAALYRRSLFSEVGLFDEDFFLGGEDTDFNLRCLVAGKRCLYVPQARVRHKLGASIDTRPTTETRRRLARNDAMVVAKDLPTFALLLVPLFWSYRLLRDTFPLRPSRWHLTPALAREAPERIRVQLEGFRMGLGKRPEVWRLKQVGMLEILRWLVRGSGPE